MDQKSLTMAYLPKGTSSAQADEMYAIFNQHAQLLDLDHKQISAFSDNVHAWDKQPIEALAFEGGGTKGIFYGGVLKRLEEEGILQKIKFVAGTSAGSQVAALVACGFSAEEVSHTTSTAPWGELLDDTYGPFRDLYRLWTHFGIYKGDFLESFLDAKFAEKLGHKQATMLDLFQKTGVTLRLACCNVTRSEMQMLTHESHPDLPLATAVRASSAIPGAFTSVEWKNEILVDGWFLNNLPAFAFPGKKTLAFDLYSKDDFVKSEGFLPSLPTNVVHHFGQLANMVIDHAQAKRMGDFEAQEAAHLAEYRRTHAVPIHHRVGALFAPCSSTPPVPLRSVDVVQVLTGNATALDTKLAPEKIKLMEATGYICVDCYISGIESRIKGDNWKP